MEPKPNARGSRPDTVFGTGKAAKYVGLSRQGLLSTDIARERVARRGTGGKYHFLWEKANLDAWRARKAALSAEHVHNHSKRDMSFAESYWAYQATIPDDHPAAAPERQARAQEAAKAAAAAIPTVARIAPIYPIALRTIDAARYLGISRSFLLLSDIPRIAKAGNGKQRKPFYLWRIVDLNNWLDNAPGIRTSHVGAAGE